ncbi:50S ribosomal protein L19 [Candidatus Kuenenbacteria bacterium]|nr:50S ribosomal protein L19 [Candidatus Kuenenbacteria bacterium]
MTEETKKEEIRAAKEKLQTLSAGEIKSGMTVRVHEKINDIDAKGKERTRVQVFEGIILSVRKQKTANGSILVRKISHNNVGVEKIYPLQSPLIDKIELVKEIKTRRAKLYFLPNYKKRVKTKKANNK